MTLALLIGYVFARQGQWIATQQNQSTAARKTAEGIWLAMEGRLAMAERVAKSAYLVEGLKEYEQGNTLDRTHLMRRLKPEAESAGKLHSIFNLYDPDGALIFSTKHPPPKSGRVYPRSFSQPGWVKLPAETRFVSFGFLEDELRYVSTILSPVRDPESGGVLGYLAEVHGVQDLLEFALGRASDELTGSSGGNKYQVVYLSEEGGGLCVYLDHEAFMDPPPLRYVEVDPRLRARLDRSKGKPHDAFFLWRYTTLARSQSVLMAYHRLPGETPLYFVAYRPVSDVFATINLGALLTAVVGTIVIGVFCVIGFRIVNNTIIRPVSLLNEGAQIIRQGDLDLKLKIDTGDEIEELASSFNRMASALRHNIQQLETSEEKYRSLFTSMRDGIYQTDADGLIRFVNPAAVEILGYSGTEDVTGLHLRDLFIEEMDYARIMSELSRHRFIEHSRVWARHATGRNICIELSANRVYDVDDDPTGVEGSFRDVTENVRLEQEARGRSERISAINQIANTINSSLEAGLVYESIVAEVRRLVHFDYAAVALFAEDSAASETLPASRRFITRQLWPELAPGAGGVSAPTLRVDGEESCAAWVAQENKPLVVDHLAEGNAAYQKQFPPGVSSCLCVPLYATGRIIGTLNLGATKQSSFSRHDVDVIEQLTPHVAVAIRNAALLENLQQSLEEVTRAREKLHEANEELKTLDEMKTNLLSNVSHELRTPLVAVMGYTDMILNAKVGPVNELQSEYLGISLRNIEKLVTLIENLLDFSRLHRGAEEMVFDMIDLTDCVRTSLEIIRPVADSREIELVIEAPEAPVLAEGDKGKLGQVFNNLLSNAVKFNDKGGLVSVQIRPVGDNVDVIVRDSGIGIPEEALDKVFTRFYQYDGSSTRKYGGTGIGLSIAQDIMRFHGSRITVTSTVGEGTTFRFSLPLARSHEEAAEGSTRLPLPTETHLLIELVTQDRALSAQIRSLLLSEGMDVIHAAYPAVAVSLANKYSPDCILLDTEAGPLGAVVVEEILSEPSASDIPVVLLTSDDMLYEQYRSVVAGRIKRGFRKSTILSGIHYALSRGVVAGGQLGDRILCVDDDPEILQFMARCLEPEGYETDGCRSGEEALERAKTGEYWLVLLDIAMPGMDGWETCEQMKSDVSLAGLKVYLVTAKTIGKDVERVRQCGADGYMAKPFKAEELLGFVQGFESRLPGRIDQSSGDSPESTASFEEADDSADEA